MNLNAMIGNNINKSLHNAPHYLPISLYREFRKNYSGCVGYMLYLLDLLVTLVTRDLKILYKKSILGIAWTLINPLLKLSVFVFVFGFVLAVDIPNYPSFIFSGLLVWAWFQDSLYQSSGVIISNFTLIKQPTFPNAILPLVTTSTGLIHFALALPVLVAFLVMDGISFKPIVLLTLPLLILLQFLLILGFAYFLAALNVVFRDTQHTLGVLLQLIFFLTPIFYDIRNLPTEYHVYYSLNPMVHIITAYRDILLQGKFPDWYALGMVFCFSLALIPLGFRLFKTQSHRFVEEL